MSEERASFWRNTWDDIEPQARAICGDILLGLMALAGLASFYLALRILAALGVPNDEVTVLETLDYWGYLGVLVVLVMGLIRQMVANSSRDS